MASAGASSDDFMMLEGEQLELLAWIVRNREERTSSKSFATEKDRVNYLTSVNEAYDLSMGLLRDANHLKYRTASRLMPEDAAGRSRLSSVVHDIHWYIEHGLNLSLQAFRICAVRTNYLFKLREHFNVLAKEVVTEDFSVGEEGVQKLIEEAKACKEAIWKYANKYRSPFGRAMAEGFRQVVKLKGQTVADVIKSHQNKLGLEGEFESLDEKEQLQVYNSVIEEALGESYGFLDKLALVGGPAVFLATAGLLVYDVITGDNHAEAALHDGLEVLNIAGSFAVQVTVEVGATEILTAMGAGALVVSLGAFVLGLAGLFFCEKAGELIDQAIGGGGTKAPELQGLTFHKITAPPDGRQIANAIAHGGY